MPFKFLFHLLVSGIRIKGKQIYLGKVLAFSLNTTSFFKRKKRDRYASPQNVLCYRLQCWKSTDSFYNTKLFKKILEKKKSRKILQGKNKNF